MFFFTKKNLSDLHIKKNMNNKNKHLTFKKYQKLIKNLYKNFKYIKKQK